ncbi:hypothetical protein AZF69_23735 [Salmonella enterica]|nr:hypothetical protein [Salmonella enterica subsp. enterica]EAY8717932.1 hypothetical protein [Salmonella enterica]EBQ1580833.1 hypothetical protein [Salmonella enterica]ECI2267498.1 hypothetical protein [Salmonella enterica subsp. enterica serovar Wandsworth]
MDAVLALLARIEEVSVLADSVQEECYRLTVTGSSVSSRIVVLCQEIEQFCRILNVSSPVYRVDNYTLDDPDELSDYLNKEACSWSIVLGKHAIASLLSSRVGFADSKDNLLYLSEAPALRWINSVDPFASIENNTAPSFDKEVIIWLYKSELCFGGKGVTVLPVSTTSLPEDTHFLQSLPERSEISELVRINANELIKIRPESFIISWGDTNSLLAKSFILLAVKCLVASICFELRKDHEDYTVMFKGTKSLAISLNDECHIPLDALQSELIKTVLWIYSERRETRLQLVMDRLSLDMIPGRNCYEELAENIGAALQQSQDSYAFVILDRKDAYHKEMRELLKDMRSQADMYASKVRDIVGNVTRDILGVFAFVGYSFLGKFDKANINELLASHELALLVKFLAGYLILSCAMQVVVHWRDASLTTEESKKWLRVLQRYTSREENKESFLEPIMKRKKTLFLALFIIMMVYTILAICTWNLPVIASYLLSTEK